MYMYIYIYIHPKVQTTTCDHSLFVAFVATVVTVATLGRAIGRAPHHGEHTGDAGGRSR